MPAHVVPGPPVSKHADEVLTYALSFEGRLTEGVVLHTDAPTISITSNATSPVLAITGVAVTTAARSINNRTVPAREAVTMIISGGVAGTTYEIKVIAKGSVADVDNTERYVGIFYLRIY